MAGQLLLHRTGDAWEDKDGNQYLPGPSFGRTMEALGLVGEENEVKTIQGAFGVEKMPVGDGEELHVSLPRQISYGDLKKNFRSFRQADQPFGGIECQHWMFCEAKGDSEARLTLVVEDGTTFLWGKLGERTIVDLRGKWDQDAPPGTRWLLPNGTAVSVDPVKAAPHPVTYFTEPK
jgi:hypothetical protein